MREEARRGLAQGRAELEATRVLIEAGPLSQAAFHCQQAAESLLKGLWIHLKRAVPPRHHDLVDPGTELDAPEPVRAALRRLNPESVVSRSPDAASGVPAENYDVERAGELLGHAARVERWVTESSA